MTPPVEGKITKTQGFIKKKKDFWFVRGSYRDQGKAKIDFMAC